MVPDHVEALSQWQSFFLALNGGRRGARNLSLDFILLLLPESLAKDSRSKMASFDAQHMST